MTSIPRVDVVFTEQQLELIDRLTNEWGLSRPEAVERACEESLGGPAATPGWSTEASAEGPIEPGPLRFQEVLQPVSGKAVPVYRGEVLRIVQVEGGQCVDFNAFNLHDYTERMSVGHSRPRGFHLVEGDTLVSNPPRRRPMLHITSMSPTCVADTLGARCNAVLFEQILGFEYHTNCQDTLAEAIREYDLTPDDVHDSFNMFMNTRWDDQGRWWLEWNTGRKGDHVDLLACMDVLCVPVTCGSGDVGFTSNFFLRPIGVEVYAPAPSTLDAVERVESRHQAPRSRKGPEDYRVRAIRTERALTRNPDYRPEYPRCPIGTETLSLSLGTDVVGALEHMVEEGLAGDLEEAIRRTFMEWYLARRSQRLGGAGRYRPQGR